MFESGRISSRVALVVALGWVVAIGASMHAVAKPLVYVPGYGSASIAALDTAANGSMFAVPGSPFATGAFPFGSAATPDGRFVYVTSDGTTSVSGYAVSANGALSALPGSPYPTPLNPRGVEVSPGGDFVYVTSFGEDSVRAYAIAADGSLSAVAPDFPTGDGANSITFTPDGTRAYVTNFGTDNVSAFVVSDDGTLASAPGSPYAAGDQPVDAEVSPDGKFLYVAANASAGIRGFSIAAGGALTPLPGSPFALGVSAPQGLTVANGGSHLYATDSADDRIEVLALQPGGSLSAEATTPTGSFPTGIETNRASNRVYAGIRDDSDLGVYDVAADGTLSEISGSPFPLGGTPYVTNFAVIDPDSQVEGAFLKAKRKQKQKRKGIVVKAKVGAAEPVDVRVGFKLGIGPRKIAYRLKSKNVSLAGGQRRAVKLKPGSRKAKRKLTRLLKKFGRGVGTVKARYADEAGNVTRVDARVKLVAKKKKRR